MDDFERQRLAWAWLKLIKRDDRVRGASEWIRSSLLEHVCIICKESLGFVAVDEERVAYCSNACIAEQARRHVDA